MTRILHVLTEGDDTLAVKFIATQKKAPENKIASVDLSQPDVDYKDLLEKIFVSDSVQVW
ncbi:MAG: hypothetical protein ABJC04_04315 [Verrucomicrobiota bacterium]